MFTVSLRQSGLTEVQRNALQDMWLRCVRRIIVSTTLAGSGHPGGSMSSLHLLLMLFSTMRHRPDDPAWPDRDRLIVSMGHISPGVYSILCEFGYIREEEFFLEFRRADPALRDTWNPVCPAWNGTRETLDRDSPPAPVWPSPCAFGRKRAVWPYSWETENNRKAKSPKPDVSQ